MSNRELLLTLAGPVLASYLQDALVTDIRCNDNGTCFVSRVRHGKQEQEHPGFPALDRFLAAVAHEVGAEWRAEHPRMSAALEDLGWRIQATRPPACPAPFMALRKHPVHVFPLEELQAQGVMTQAQVDLLTQAITTRQRIIFCGGVGTAKTTMINSVLHHIRDKALCVVILEDQPEILCTIRDCNRTWSIPGKFGLREMVQDSLRSNPDLLVIGEVRDGTALDMLKALQTGHGGITTVHVDQAEHVGARFEQLILEVSATPQQALIGEVIDLIVQMQRDPHTGWRCAGIWAMEGWDGHQYVQRKLA